MTSYKIPRGFPRRPMKSVAPAPTVVDDEFPPTRPACDRTGVDPQTDDDDAPILTAPLRPPERPRGTIVKQTPFERPGPPPVRPPAALRDKPGFLPRDRSGIGPDSVAQPTPSPKTAAPGAPRPNPTPFRMPRPHGVLRVDAPPPPPRPQVSAPSLKPTEEPVVRRVGDDFPRRRTDDEIRALRKQEAEREAAKTAAAKAAAERPLPPLKNGRTLSPDDIPF